MPPWRTPSPRKAWRITSRAGSPASTVPRESPIMARAAAIRPLRSTAYGRPRLTFTTARCRQFITFSNLASAPNLYPRLPRRRPGVRPAQGGAEVRRRRQTPPIPASPQSTAARSMTPRSRAGATAGTPFGDRLTERSANGRGRIPQDALNTAPRSLSRFVPTELQAFRPSLQTPISATRRLLALERVRTCRGLETLDQSTKLECQ